MLKKHKVNPLEHRVEFKQADALSIYLETRRLIIRSIQQDDEHAFIKLFADPKVVEKFGTGKPFEEKVTVKNFTVWQSRWKNQDPFSMYAITEKSSGEFVGAINLGHVASGTADISYLIHHQFWGKGYGTEMMDAVFQSLIPRIMLRNYSLEHAPLKKVVATARIDNPVSQHMLTSVGFREEEKIFKYEGWRFSYSLFAKQLRNEHQNFFTHRDRKQSAEFKDQGVDVTDEEMTTCAFGQQSNTAKKRR